MKTLKKILAIVLTMSIFLSICTFSTFAASEILDTIDNGDSANFAQNYLEGKGSAKFNVNSRTIDYGLWIRNKLDVQVTYCYNAQCAVDYADETQDSEDYYGYWYFWGIGEDNASQPMYLPSGKTVVKIDTEYHISSADTELWYGYILKTYTPGINI